VKTLRDVIRDTLLCFELLVRRDRELAGFRRKFDFAANSQQAIDESGTLVYG